MKPAIDFNLGLFKNTISQNFWNKVFLVNDHHQPVADHVTRESYVCFVTMLGIVWTETPLLNRDPSFPRPAWRPRPGGRQSASDPGHVSVPSERWSGFISRREIQICSLRIFYVDDVLFFLFKALLLLSLPVPASVWSTGSYLGVREPLRQGWGTCDPRDHLIWPASEFALPEVQRNIGSKRNSVVNRHVDRKWSLSRTLT